MFGISQLQNNINNTLLNDNNSKSYSVFKTPVSFKGERIEMDSFRKSGYELVDRGNSFERKTWTRTFTRVAAFLRNVDKMKPIGHGSQGKVYKLDGF